MQFSHLSLSLSFPLTVMITTKTSGEESSRFTFNHETKLHCKSPGVALVLRYLLGSWRRQSRSLPQLLSSHLHETCLHQETSQLQWRKSPRRTGCGEIRKNEKATETGIKSCWTTKDITLSLVLNLDVTLDFLLDDSVSFFSTFSSLLQLSFSFHPPPLRLFPSLYSHQRIWLSFSSSPFSLIA